MKKVVLINPKGYLFGKNKKLRDFLEQSNTMESFRYLWSGPNLGLITIAAYMPEEWDIEYIDENHVDIDYSRHYDMVCISAMTQQVTNAYRISDEFRHRNMFTVIGGIHATILPEEAMQHADTVIAGEGEALWPKFVQDYANNDIKRLYREDSPGSYPLKDALMPRYELFKGYDYPLITLYTTRGCPHKCSFCCASNIFGVKYRRKDNIQIIAELNKIKELYPGKIILFADDNLFVMHEASKELLRSMQGMNIRWIAQADISIANKSELLELMAVAGCQWVVIGFETISPENIKDIDTTGFKTKYCENYKTLIDKIQSYGIGVYGTFIVGLDFDTTKVFDNTIEFIVDSNLYGVNITVPTPLPGTMLRDRYLVEGRVISSKWEDYTFWDVNIVPRNMTVEQLEDGLLNMYRNVSGDFVSQKRLSYFKKTAINRKKLVEEYYMRNNKSNG